MHVSKVLSAALFLVWAALAPVPVARSGAVGPAQAEGRAPAPARGPASSTEPTAADFDAAVARLRTLDAALADEYVSLKTDVLKLIPETVTEENQVPVVSSEQIADFDRRLHLIRDRGGLIEAFKVTPDDEKADAVAYSFVWLRVALLCIKSAPVDFKEVSGALTLLESKADQLDKDTAFLNAGANPATKAPFSQRLNALNMYGTQIWNRLQANALNVADMGNPVLEKPGRNGGAPEYEPNVMGRLGLDINPLQKRMSDLAHKLQMINDRLWGAVPVLNDPNRQSDALRVRANKLLHDPFVHLAGGTAVVDKGIHPVKAMFFQEPLVLTAAGLQPAPKTLLDMARVPTPGVKEVPDVKGPKPAVFAGEAGRDSNRKETARINALRQQGLTRTIGDPVRRAAFVYPQEGSTCGLGAQVQVLADAGVIRTDPASLKEKEDEMYARAVRLGFFNGSSGDPKRRENGGTANQRVGDLLDMPVRKHFAAKDEELFEAVKTGRMIIIGADTERLWNNRRFRGGGHFVAITGAEVDRKTGKPLGYYVNDTGTNEGGRFITLKQFNSAWHRHSRMFVEPL